MSKDTDFYFNLLADPLRAQARRDFKTGELTEAPMDATVHYLPTPLVLVANDDIVIHHEHQGGR